MALWTPKGVFDVEGGDECPLCGEGTIQENPKKFSKKSPLFACTECKKGFWPVREGSNYRIEKSKSEKIALADNSGTLDLILKELKAIHQTLMTNKEENTDWGDPNEGGV